MTDLPSGAQLSFPVPPSQAMRVARPQPPKLTVELPRTAMLVMPVKGGQGPAGAPGGGFRVFREIPVGVKDGVNTTYTTANPFQPGTLMAYRNGLVEFESAESGDQAVVFSDPPEDTDHIYVDYTV